MKKISFGMYQKNVVGMYYFLLSQTEQIGMHHGMHEENNELEKVILIGMYFEVIY